MNVMTHGLEQRSPQLPLGIDVLSCYATLTTGSNRVAVALRYNTNDWVEIGKGTPIARMETANQVPPVDGGMVACESSSPRSHVRGSKTRGCDTEIGPLWATGLGA